MLTVLAFESILHESRHDGIQVGKSLGWIDIARLSVQVCVMELILWGEGRVNRVEGPLWLIDFSEHFGL